MFETRWDHNDLFNGVFNSNPLYTRIQISFPPKVTPLGKKKYVHFWCKIRSWTGHTDKLYNFQTFMYRIATSEKMKMKRLSLYKFQRATRCYLFTGAYLTKTLKFTRPNFIHALDRPIQKLHTFFVLQSRFEIIFNKEIIKIKNASCYQMIQEYLSRCQIYGIAMTMSRLKILYKYKYYIDQ